MNDSGDIYELDNGTIKAEIETRGAYVRKIDYLNNPLVVPSADSKETHGGSAVLIPYANRVRNAVYSYNGKRYNLPENSGKHSIHGLMSNRPFECVSSDQRSIELSCHLIDPGYPSELIVSVKYSITRNSFRTLVSTVNTGREPAPYMVGFHPYIYTGKKWNITTEGSIEKLQYEDEYFPNGNTEKFNFNSIDDLSLSDLDNCFRGSGRISVHTAAGTVVIERKNFPYFVVYNGQYSRGISAAIEPMTGAPDCFNNGIGRIELMPESKHECSFSISVP